MKVPPGRVLVATTDAVVEGVHFDRRWFAPEDVGWKALAVNLSDLAAMGAQPRWFLCAVACRKGEDPRWLSGVARGMAACARAHGGEIVGGNFSAAPTGAGASFTITAIGEAAPKRLLTRAGARPGDWLFVVGELGRAAEGLARLRGGERGHASARAHLRPTPRVIEGLAAARYATACIDVSDGLARDLGHVCRASRCGAVVELAALEEPWELAAAGGEDYALLLAVPPARARSFGRALPAARRIGEFVHSAGVRFVAPDGSRWRSRAVGWDHFAR